MNRHASPIQSRSSSWTRLERWMPIVPLAGLAVGGAFWLTGRPEAATWIWGAVTLVVLVPLAIGVARDLARGRTGVDAIALLAMAGALLLGETLAGAVVALMLAGGQALERYADGRARRELSALASRAPEVVERLEGDQWVTRPLAEVRLRDRLLVKPGLVVPVDGIVVAPAEAEGAAVLDESAITGEARLVERLAGDRVRAGTVNAGVPFQLLATTTAETSTYAAIVRLVEQAQASKAPLVRLADRFAVGFLPLTLAVAAAGWAISGDPVRALAVLVVATPCPLILAAPIAIVAGISRAAGRGIIVKGGGALETLARAELLLLDKTGTITGGTPVLAEVVPIRDLVGDRPGSGVPGPDEGGAAATGTDELLRLAASLDQVSPHVLAAGIVGAARERGLRLELPTDSREESGSGIAGTVSGRAVRLGRPSWITDEASLPPAARQALRRAGLDGSSAVLVEVDGEPAGVLLLEDRIRADAPRTLRALRRCGIERIVLLTGDHPDLAEMVAVAIGVDQVLAEQTPEQKVQAVEALGDQRVTVMVGDGINDAPALARADVGVAMGARGASASSEAADVVLVPDRLDRLVEAFEIARRSRRIALESIWVGMGLSSVAMVVAAFGYLPPVFGALLQEVIDVAVILNALRALGGRSSLELASDPEIVALRDRFRDEHRHLRPQVQRLRQLADRLDELAPAQALEEIVQARAFLVEEVIPHDRAETHSLYPKVADLIGGRDPTATMDREHSEIERLVLFFSRFVDDLPPEGPRPQDHAELRRVLYGLYAILEMHLAQEDEAFFALIEGQEERTAVPAASGDRP
ncbi:MAG TPA: heavy metal translocating P-type ATPase [Thermoanaerobaculia bacterium]|nr:heavy metal translocating P-type ATPase [Thermoanaerobaculia bacterium]